MVKGRGEFWKNESGVVTVFLDQTDTNRLLFVDESRSILLDQPPNSALRFASSTNSALRFASFQTPSQQGG